MQVSTGATADAGTVIFGLNMSTSAAPGADPVADALEAQRLGFDFVSANDHPNGRMPTHELWTLLTWMAAKTSRIGIASRVIGVPYRNPALLAKMAASLDQLSDGRLILGLGGGSSDEGMRAFGIDATSPRAKMDALEDALNIVRGMWSEARSTYDGAIHSVSGADLEPKPRRPIPIWLGTYGPRGVAMVGRFADGWIPSLDMVPPERARAMREVIFDAAREAGRDPEAIRFVYNLEARLGERDADPAIVSGSIDEVTERFLGLIDVGFSGFNLIPTGPEPDADLERLAHEVLPAVRSRR